MLGWEGFAVQTINTGKCTQIMLQLIYRYQQSDKSCHASACDHNRAWGTLEWIAQGDFQLAEFGIMHGQAQPTPAQAAGVSLPGRSRHPPAAGQPQLWQSRARCAAQHPCSSARHPHVPVQVDAVIIANRGASRAARPTRGHMFQHGPNSAALGDMSGPRSIAEAGMRLPSLACSPQHQHQHDTSSLP